MCKKGDVKATVKPKAKPKIKSFACDYCNKTFDTEKGARCHENLYCKKKPFCKTCGRNGHYASKCYATTTVDGDDIDSDDDEDYNFEDSNDDYEIVDDSSVNCYKCGRKGHYTDDCYARTHVKGHW